MQELFCTEYVANGGDGTAAATAAGYAKASAHVQASKNLNIPSICAAILQLAMMRQARSVPGAQAVVERLSTKAKSEYVQLEASKDILNRAGIVAPTRVQVAAGVSISIDLGD